MKSTFIALVFITLFVMPVYSQLNNYDKSLMYWITNNIPFSYSNVYYYNTVDLNRKMIINSQIKGISQNYTEFNIKTQKEKASKGRCDYKFDNKGNLTEYTEYNHKGNISRKEQFMYNDSNRMMYTAIFNSKNIRKQERVIKFDESGNEIEDATFNKRDITIAKIETKYNKNNIIIETIEYRRGGTKIKERYFYTYDDNCNLMNIISYNTDGKIKHKWIYDCNPTCDAVDNLRDTTRVCKMYDTDSTGNKVEIKLITTNNNKVRKYITTYDCNSNIIAYMYCNPKGKIMYHKTYSYENNKNLSQEILYKRNNTNANCISYYAYNEKNLCTHFTFLYGRNLKRFSTKENTYNTKGNPLEFKSSYSNDNNHYYLAKYTYEYYTD